MGNDIISSSACRAQGSQRAARDVTDDSQGCAVNENSGSAAAKNGERDIHVGGVLTSVSVNSQPFTSNPFGKYF